MDDTARIWHAFRRWVVARTGSISSGGQSLTTALKEGSHLQGAGKRIQQKSEEKQSIPAIEAGCICGQIAKYAGNDKCHYKISNQLGQCYACIPFQSLKTPSHA